MAFYGCEFVFDGKSCDEYGLMVYKFGSKGQDDIAFNTGGKIYEDTTARRRTTFFYGIEQNEPMEYTLVFGANPKAIDIRTPLDRFEIEAIAAWLTGHSTQKWLEIVQPDMETFRYKCIISELEPITDEMIPWAFQCTVHCDSPFGYTYPEKYRYSLSSSPLKIRLHNRSTYNGYYCPMLTFNAPHGGDLSIVNRSDNNREFKFTGLPTGLSGVTVDNENQVITEPTGLNLYKYFNFKFLRLVRGDNFLDLTGNGDIVITCEFPVNIGG